MSSVNKVKHSRNSAAYYKAMAVEQFYEHGHGARLFFESPYYDSYDVDTEENDIHGARLFFESPYYDSYDVDTEENDIIPDRIVDRFGRTILSF
jgi:hypothetical protein